MSGGRTEERQTDDGSHRKPRPPPAIIQLMSRFNTFMAWDFPPGPHLIPTYVITNLQKGGTILYCLSLMRKYNNYSVPAMLYTCAHGSYGLCWLLKHNVFPDPAWNKKATIMGIVNSFALVLGPYWIPAFLLISRRVPEPSNARCVGAMFLYVLGLAVMLVADAQKFYRLKYSRGLITDGMFKYVRHPNYLGEMMIYSSFVAMVPHWLPKAIVAYVWLALFSVNIANKESSLSRYEGWNHYCKQAGLLVPNFSLMVRDLLSSAKSSEERE